MRFIRSGKSGLLTTALVLALMSFSGGVAFGAAVCVNSTTAAGQVSAANQKKNWENLQDLCALPLVSVAPTTIAGNPALVANAFMLGTTGFIFEGSTANTSETLITVTDPTADRIITFPDATGTVALTSDITGGLDPDGTSGGLNLNGGLLASEFLSLRADAADAGDVFGGGPFIEIIGTTNTTKGWDPPNSGGAIYAHAGSSDGIMLESQNGSRSVLINNDGVNIVATGSHSVYVDGTNGVSVTGKITFDTLAQLTPAESPPAACSGPIEGAIYADTSHAFCFCDGTTWQKVIGEGSCA